MQASGVSFTSGTLVIIASIFGLPVPLTQCTTTAIVGMGFVNKGMRIWQKSVIKQIMLIWLVSPVTSLTVSYVLMNIVHLHDYFTLALILSVLIAAIGITKLLDVINKERSNNNNNGGGI